MFFVTFREPVVVIQNGKPRAYHAAWASDIAVAVDQPRTGLDHPIADSCGMRIVHVRSLWTGGAEPKEVDHPCRIYVRPENIVSVFPMPEAKK